MSRAGGSDVMNDIVLCGDIAEGRAEYLCIIER